LPIHNPSKTSHNQHGFCISPEQLFAFSFLFKQVCL